ncbi:MAG TPA: hypothetical protein VHA33_14425 [Candidatus Angelobacter sp.]|jgi:uncharacterized membrane protein YkoI|nr:hypothetical protein [Candidatus Angelobacter sp.]
MKHPIKYIAIMALTLLFALAASAQEKKIKKADMPPAVQKAADEQSKGATVKGYSTEVEDGKTLYEVELAVNGHSKDVSMTPDGAVVEVEEEVALNSLPAEVQEGLKKKAGAGKITKVESLTKQGKLVAYEAQVRTNGKKSEVQVGPDGKPLAHPE